METSQQRGVRIEIYDENEDKKEQEVLKPKLWIMLTPKGKSNTTISSFIWRSRLDTPIYSRSLNPKELIYWIRSMEKIFEFDQI